MIFKTIYRKIKQRVYKKIYLYEAPLELTGAVDLPAFRLLPMTQDLFEVMTRQKADEISQRKVQMLNQRLDERSNEKAYVVEDDTHDILGYYHLASEHAWNSSIRDSVHIPEGSIYLFDDYTFKASRKRGVHKFAVAKRMAIARESGLKIALVQINADNLVSQKTYESMGFRKKQVIHHIRLGAWHKNIVRNI